jgi:hypothetical protein
MLGDEPTTAIYKEQASLVFKSFDSWCKSDENRNRRKGNEKIDTKKMASFLMKEKNIQKEEKSKANFYVGIRVNNRSKTV